MLKGHDYSNTPSADAFLDRRKETHPVLHTGNGQCPTVSVLALVEWQALRTGEPQNEAKKQNLPPVRRAPHRPTAPRRFLKAMTGLSLGAAAALSAVSSWQNYKTFVDIGTAQGGLPVQIADVDLTGFWLRPHPGASRFDRYVAEHGLV